MSSERLAKRWGEEFLLRHRAAPFGCRLNRFLAKLLISWFCAGIVHFKALKVCKDSPVYHGERSYCFKWEIGEKKLNAGPGSHACLCWKRGIDLSSGSQVAQRPWCVLDSPSCVCIDTWVVMKYAAYNVLQWDVPSEGRFPWLFLVLCWWSVKGVAVLDCWNVCTDLICGEQFIRRCRNLWGTKRREERRWGRDGDSKMKAMGLISWLLKNVLPNRFSQLSTGFGSKPKEKKVLAALKDNMACTAEPLYRHTKDRCRSEHKQKFFVVFFKASVSGKWMQLTSKC